MPAPISVVIPTYNRARYVAGAVESVRRQELRAAEIIVVDDGSTDDTEAVCRAFEGEVRYIRQANAGVSAARNRGAREAVGELIAFLDSDDLWYPARLAAGAAALTQFAEAGWCIGNLDLIGLDGAPRPGRQGFEAVFPVFDAERAAPAELFGRFLRPGTVTAAANQFPVFVGDAFDLLFRGNVAHASAALVRRDLFRRLGGFDESFRVAEDTEFFHRLAAASPVVVFTTPLAAWRVGQTETLTSSGNIAAIVDNALTSLGRAAALRPLSDETRAVLRARRQSELRLLAFAHLTALQGREARSALRRLRMEGGGRDPKSLAIFVASWLPRSVLRGLHRAKRMLRS